MSLEQKRVKNTAITHVYRAFLTPFGSKLILLKKTTILLQKVPQVYTKMAVPTLSLIHI